MRIALSSTAFDRALRSGEITQLELLDRCACVLGVDGVVLDLAHFPRRDREYAAQLKKFAADLGLSIVAVRDDSLASAPGSVALELAAELGAQYVLMRLPEGGIDPVAVYGAAMECVSAAVSEAKKRNVTLAVRNVPGSLASDAFGLGRIRKEADSAWLRFALDVPALDAEVDEKIRARTVLGYRLVAEVAGDGVDPNAHAICAALEPFPGFLCLDYNGAEAEAAAVRRLIEGWRTVLAGRSVAEPHVPS